ncbi:rhodanese-like domain-containing protein 9, chloroplastic isoform X2 [Carya illinoinensis]|uniref:rhodanese-like domain-containing protein 9, chloroplastic isoform X2 n=1 Tax=Carya illinoinensis TaxID=32201 RepID=UPI001C718201|nr:rhodanese-like domain-containing protein 9, chloroplastic isoform X2 [Carya illinoinensis]
MAGIGFSSALSATRNFQTSWLVSETHSRRTLPGKLNHRKNLNVKAEVNYVDAEEAKKLIAVEEYAILDVRDKSQYDRAHIKSCCHVPLFIENKDGDFGTIIKRTLHNNFSGLFFGLPFTKPNPDFVQSIKSQFSPESKLVLVCQEGLRLNYELNLNWIFILSLWHSSLVWLKPMNGSFRFLNHKLASYS